MTSATPSLFEQAIQAPFPGLRPFQPHESRIFFGRSEHVADMLTILENHRFLAVVGPSGGGKSSLVLAGLLPALDQGALLTARPGKWHFVTMRPGDAPFRNLANALQRRLRPEDGGHRFHGGDPAFTELVLRESPFGFVDVLRDAAIPAEDNVLLLVDQFEELFRFRAPEAAGGASVAQRRDDASAFVQLLIETAKHNRRPVYLMLTMRTDFLGDCDVFDGLPQMINQSQYLTPRLNLSQLSEAITGPLQVAPFYGSVTPEVVQRILNDVGTARDELPLVQHVLFRTWQETQKPERAGEPAQLTVTDYEAVGGLKDALSRHADEALKELRAQGKELLVEKVFRSLSARSPNGQQIRRPATVQQIANESGYPVSDVIAVVEAFRRADRSFLLPPSDRPIDAATTVDITHESLLRQWSTLKAWAGREAEDAAEFIRLRDAASRWPKQESLLRDPALTIALAWKEQLQPSEAWAERYGGGLARALEYLRESEEARTREAREAEEARQREIALTEESAMQKRRHAQRLFAVGVVFSIVAAAGMMYGVLQTRKAEEAQKRASAAVRYLNDISIETEKVLKEKEQIDAFLAQYRAREVQRARYNDIVAAVERADGTVRQEIDGLAVVFRPNASPDGVLGQLAELGLVTSLDLSRTNVSDQGLGQLGRMKGLQVLDLSATNVGDGSIDAIAAIGGLAHLRLGETVITDKGAARLVTLASLKTLDISRNRITPRTVSRVKAALRGCDVAYERDPLLETLARSGGNWNTALAAVNGQYDKGSLYVLKSEVSDAAMRAALRALNVEELRLLFSNRITADALRNAERLTKLRRVSIGMCSRMTDAALENLSKAPNLNEIDLLTFQLTDEGLRAISQATHLKELEIHGTGHAITDRGVSHLKQLRRLEKLALSFTDIGDPSMKEIAKLRNLRSLELTANERVAPSAYGELKGMRGLRSLSVGLVQSFSDDDLAVFEGMKQLEKLTLTGMPFTSQGVEKLRTALPNTEIEWDGIGAPTPPPPPTSSQGSQF